MKQYLKPSLIIVGIVVVFFLLNNINFLWQNVQYTFVKPQPAPAQEPVEQDTPNTLWIDSLSLTAPIVQSEGESEDDFQKALQNGVVHYPGTAQPGQEGNVFIFGHSSDYAFTPGKYKSVFALLPRVEEGAMIKITNAEGKVFQYKVVEKIIVGPNAVEYLEQGEDQHILTLQTSYPVGTALKRFLAIARLQE